MPFARPTLTALRDRIAADINAEIPGADARLRRSNLGVFARMSAGVAHGLYGFVDFVQRQILADVAEAEFLERHSAIWGMERRAAARAVGTATATGANASVIPAGTILQRSDGVEYTVTEEATIAEGAAAVEIEAVEPGVAGNADAASTLSFVSPVAGVDSDATVVALSAGAEAETDASLRARLVDRIQLPPHGGARFDYEKWALEVPGVTRVWVYPLEQGIGTVVVRFVCDDDPAGPIPSVGKVAEVQAYIDERRPVTADVTVVAPVAVALDVTVDGLEPDTAEIRASIDTEIADMLRRDAEPAGTIRLSKIWEAVSVASGEQHHVITAPAADVAHATGEIAVPGIVTYT